MSQRRTKRNRKSDSFVPPAVPAPFTAGAVCPSCERFIGPADPCPYCDADSRRHPALRWLCRLVPVAAVALLAALYVVSLRRPTPLVAVRDIRPTMNFGSIRVAGTVARDPRWLDSPGRRALMLRLDDGSGQLRVIVDGAPALHLLREDRVPRKGESLTLGGTLQCRASGSPLLRVHSARQVRGREGPGA